MAPWRLPAALCFVLARAIVGARIAVDLTDSSQATRLEQDAAGWDLRAKLEEKVLETFLVNTIAVGPNSTGYPGKIEVRLCDTRDNKKASENAPTLPFSVKCASTVAKGESIGLAIAGLQLCLSIRFENFDLTSVKPLLFLHGTMAVRITMPFARLGFVWDCTGVCGPSGFFNAEDARAFEFDLLSWKAEKQENKFSLNRLGGAPLRSPGLINFVMQKIDLSGRIARKIASKVDAFSSKMGAKTVTRMLTSNKAQRVASNFAWYTGYGSAACSNPEGSVDQGN